MDWGILQGLGQGLQQVGGMKMEEDAAARRAALAEKLQVEREKREQMRYDPAQDKVKTGENGVLFKVKHNKAGDEIGREPLDQLETDEINRGVQKDKLTNDSLAAAIEANKATTEGKRLDIDWAKEDRGALSPTERANVQRVKGGLIPSADTKYSTDGSLQRAFITESGKDSREDEPTIAEYADDYLEQNPGIAAKYIDTEILTKNQAKDAVIQVLREFSKRGVKPTQADFDNAIEAYSKKTAPKKKDGGIKMDITG